MITEVQITKNALKDLKRTPLYLQEKFRAWLVAVNKSGLEETKKQRNKETKKQRNKETKKQRNKETKKHPGWHGEPLLGDRKGQRSIRLNKQWRAIYIIKSNGTIEFVEITEVMPHEY